MNESDQARYFSYASTANPIHEGLITPVPHDGFPSTLHQEGGTRVIPLDLSDALGCEGPATTPACCANFVRIVAGDRLDTTADATSQLFYVMNGRGVTRSRGRSWSWSKGDFLVLPADDNADHEAEETASLYWAHDAPLLRYLGVKTVRARFAPTHYPHDVCEAELAKIKADPVAGAANRVALLLGNAEFPQTRTITHTMWAMLGALPARAVQPPHRHQSVALDLVVDCPPEGCYTMLGTELGADGMIKNGIRKDWSPQSSFVTPPGWWHSHHNESDVEARVLPMQDAGLHTYLRTLDIIYSHPEAEKPYVSPVP